MVTCILLFPKLFKGNSCSIFSCVNAKPLWNGFQSWIGQVLPSVASEQFCSLQQAHTHVTEKGTWTILCMEIDKHVCDPFGLRLFHREIISIWNNFLRIFPKDREHDCQSATLQGSLEHWKLPSFTQQAASFLILKKKLIYMYLIK